MLWQSSNLTATSNSMYGTKPLRHCPSNHAPSLQPPTQGLVQEVHLSLSAVALATQHFHCIHQHKQVCCETASGSPNCCFGSPEHPRYIHQDNVWCRIPAGKPDCGVSSVSAVSTQGKHTNTQANAQLVQQAANFGNFAGLFVDASKACQTNLHVWWHSWQRRM